MVLKVYLDANRIKMHDASAMAKKDKNSNFLTKDVTIAHNRRAKYDYHLMDTFDAGIQLFGTEVKSLRQGQASINEAFVKEEKNEIFLINANIQQYPQAGSYFQHEPARKRKLLLNRREINKLSGGVQKQGLTIVPVKLYFDGKGLAKIMIALAKGKKLHDKRLTEKNRDWNRQKAKILKDNS
jgi:SsrA-binding protein